jgi:N-acetylmuramoyl-L-alanine amidase
MLPSWTSGFCCNRADKIEQTALQKSVWQKRPLSYTDRLDSRRADSINMVVIHCTELPDLETARIWGEKLVHKQSRTGNSGHFYIDRDGSVEQWVPLKRVAHHVRDHNINSVGIELVNSGRYPNWFHSEHQQMTERYPDEQIDALVLLLNDLVAQLPELKIIAGHEQLDLDEIPAEDDAQKLIRRKLDPGSQFPWQALLAAVPLQRFTQ